MWAEVREERFENYQKSGGGSASMMDHYYDKLLQVNRQMNVQKVTKFFLRLQSSPQMLFSVPIWLRRHREG